MNLEFQLWEGRLAEQISQYILGDNLVKNRKVKKIIKSCQAIVEGEILSDELVGKQLKWLDKESAQKPSPDIVLFQVILFAGHEQFNDAQIKIQEIIQQYPNFELTAELENIMAYIKLFEKHSHDTLKDDAFIVLKYQEESGHAGALLWKLSTVTDDKILLKELCDEALKKNSHDIPLIEFEIWLLQQEDNHQEVVSRLEKVLTNLSEVDDKVALSRIYLSMAHSFFALNNFQGVIDTIEQGLKLVEFGQETILHQPEYLTLKIRAVIGLSENGQLPDGLKQQVTNDMQALEGMTADEGLLNTLNEKLREIIA